MITGDAALTACHVAKTVGITRKPVVIAQGDTWTGVDVSLPISSVPSREFDLCVTGDSIDKIDPVLLPRVRVYARTSPVQKEAIVNSLKSRNWTVLMCGISFQIQVMVQTMLVR